MMNEAYPTTGSEQPSAVLIVQHGPQPGQRFPLSKPRVTIGREADNDVVIEEVQVSRRHADLAWDGRYWIVQDLGSVNGTYVNGVRLTAPRVLQEGDAVGLGLGVLLAFRAQPAPAMAAGAVSAARATDQITPPEGIRIDRARPAGGVPDAAPPPEGGPKRRLGGPLLIAAAVLGVLLVAVVAAYLLWPRDGGGVEAPVASPLPVEGVETAVAPATEEAEPSVAVDTVPAEEATAVEGPAVPPPASGTAPSALIQPQDLTYLGAFRLPDDADPPRTFEYGGNAMTFNPDGDPANADPYPGSLFITGHDRIAYGELPDGDQVAEVSIPVPALAASPAGLPQAAFIQNFQDVTAGYFTPVEEMPKVGMQYLNHPATGPKIHLVWGGHLQPNDVASHAWFNPTLDAPDFQGTWFIGDLDLYSTTRYLFEIPASWADAYAQGRYLATGRMRDGGQGGMGPALVAYRPWLADGSAPPSGTRLEATTLLLYENAYNTLDFVRCMNGYQYPDEWEGGAWITTPSGKSAVLFAGTKSTGAKMWYGFINPLGPEYACVDVHVTDFDTCRMADGSSCPPEDYVGCCDEEQEACVSYRGWWSTRFDAQFILYDPADLAQVAAGAIESWEPQPYASVDIDEHLYLDPPEWDLVTVGWGDQRRNRIGPAAYDRDSALLYVLERYGEGAKPVVHVWRVEG